jgi:hypothetical protein
MADDAWGLMMHDGLMADDALLVTIASLPLVYVVIGQSTPQHSRNNDLALSSFTSCFLVGYHGRRIDPFLADESTRIL